MYIIELGIVFFTTFKLKNVKPTSWKIIDKPLHLD